MRLAATVTLLATGCVTGPEPVDLARFQTSQPEFGLTRGPDGWYVARQSGEFGTSAPLSIWRYPFDGGDAERVTWVRDDASEYDFSYFPSAARACFTVDLRENGASQGDIWCAEWNATGWSTPMRLPAPVNTAGYEASPHLAPDGSLYFASQREGGAGRGDIYRASMVEGAWQVEMLGEAINSPTGEWNLSLSPDGTVMVFEASGRETNRTVSGDLYLSCMVDGEWQSTEPMHALNTDGSDLEFRFAGSREGVFTSATIGGDGVLRFAGPENFTTCE